MKCKIWVFLSKIDKSFERVEFIWCVYEVGGVVGATHGKVYANVFCLEQKWL